ncbi:MAG: AMP-binding protein [Planctomycetes bacterium]|nr:AMP-binding protein [Planctomycetota bacterium]
MIEPSARTLGELVRLRARELGEKPYIHFGEETWSFRRFADVVARLAGGFRRLGIEKGDVVHVYMNNKNWTFAADVALASIGAVAGPLNCLWGSDETGYVLRDSGAVGALVESCYRPAFETARKSAPRCKHVVEFETPEWEALARGEPDPLDAAAPDDTAFLFYTSGTTGEPKGVPLTHANALWAAAGIREILHSSEERGDEVGLIFLPIFHVNAMMSLVSALNSGVTIVLRPMFSASEFGPLVQKHKVSFFSGVPTIYRILLQVADQYAGLDLSSLKFGVCGAAPLPADLIGRFEERFGFKIIEGYGLTEGTVASTLNPIDGTRKVGSIGKAIPGQEVAILDDEGHVLPPNTLGEIAIKGPNVMAGYLNKPAANREVFDGGWFRTGDIGNRDEEGYFYIVDRKKDMYIRGGENVYPKEVEAAIQTHPAVQEAAVIGVPDEFKGEEGKAFVVLLPGENLTPEELQTYLTPKLAEYKIPKYVEFTPSLPKNIVGKVLKKELRKNQDQRTK